MVEENLLEGAWNCEIVREQHYRCQRPQASATPFLREICGGGRSMGGRSGLWHQWKNNRETADWKSLNSWEERDDCLQKKTLFETIYITTSMDAELFHKTVNAASTVSPSPIEDGHHFFGSARVAAHCKHFPKSEKKTFCHYRIGYEFLSLKTRVMMNAKRNTCVSIEWERFLSQTRSFKQTRYQTNARIQKCP